MFAAGPRTWAFGLANVANVKASRGASCAARGAWGALRPAAPCAVLLACRPKARRAASAASDGRPGRALSDFQVGQQVSGSVVQIYCPKGVSVDVGCRDTLAFLEVEEFCDGFPREGPFAYSPGDQMNARVLEVDPDASIDEHGEPDPFGEHGDSGKLRLTLRSGPLPRPGRYVADTARPANLEPFKSIPHEEWLEGEVVMMSSWAAYVKVQAACGTCFVGILGEEDFQGSFAEDAIRGLSVLVRIKQVDSESRRLLLTMQPDEKGESRQTSEQSFEISPPAASEILAQRNLAMEGKASMEAKPDHTPDESKKKRPKPGVQPWHVGAASAGVVLLCAGAWCLWRQAQEESRILAQHASPLKSRNVKVDKPKMKAAEESDSLEDVLSKLEGSDPVPRKERKSKAKRAKKAEEAEGDEENAKELIQDTLRKLEAEGTGKKGSKTKKTIEKLKALLGEDEEPEEVTEEQQSHMDFAKAIQEEQKRKIHVDMKTVRSEFKRDFGNDARSLLCSGCKMVAGRLSSELDTHDVHDQESPAQMLAAKRKAIDSTCSSLRHLQAVKSEEGARFEASEEVGEGEREGKRLCAGILEESRFDILARLIQRKIPEMQMGERHPNWERWLCAERMRLCKRSEVRHDEDDEIDQDL
ncbi:unnamed protein product [Effrenium voratum]|nr:unnamed protein product [Effrenium voratum]